MTRSPFYQVSPDAYLYQDRVKISGTRKRLEEPVRQWCAHELIRAYGIKASNIEFERPVRMGSRNHWIDILVSNDGRPSVVVECKAPSNRKADEGMDQALSYADAPEIRAEYVVFTNGTDWHVQRRVNGRWCSVADLPRELDSRSAVPVTDLLRGINVLAPLLYKLNNTLEGEDAQRFLAAMQQFFHGRNLLTLDTDQNLLIATDNLLRVISLADENPNYRMGKLATAIHHLELYRKRTGIGFEAFLGDGSASQELQHLRASLSMIVEAAPELSGADLSLLRLCVALSEYGMRQGLPGQLYPEVAPNVHHTLHEFLNYSLILHLNFSLPDALDNILIGDMRHYCRSAWDNVEIDQPIAFWEALGMWVGFLFEKVRFFRNPIEK